MIFFTVDNLLLLLLLWMGWRPDHVVNNSITLQVSTWLNKIVLWFIGGILNLIMIIMHKSFFWPISITCGHVPVADPGIVKREGRESKWRQRGGGGEDSGRHIFFPLNFFFFVIYIMGRGTVRLPDRSPGWKERKKQKQKRPKKGAAAAADSAAPPPPPPPPPGSATACLRLYVLNALYSWCFMHLLPQGNISSGVCTGREIVGWGVYIFNLPNNLSSNQVILRTPLIQTNISLHLILPRKSLSDRGVIQFSKLGAITRSQYRWWAYTINSTPPPVHPRQTKPNMICSLHAFEATVYRQCVTREGQWK